MPSPRPESRNPGALQRVHGRPAPHRWRHQHRPVERCGRFGEDAHGHRAAHALPQQIEWPTGVRLAQQCRHRPGIVHERRRAGPDAPLGGGAEAALVIGIGGKALGGKEGPHLGEGLPVVVEPMQGKHDCAWRALRPPGAQGQLCAVCGDHVISLQARSR